MTTAFFTHEDCLGHITSPNHPERVARLEQVLDRLSASEFDALDRRSPRIADVAEVAMVHTPGFIDYIRTLVPEGGYAKPDPDTAMSPGSYPAALRAVGAACEAMDAVFTEDDIKNAFCAIRPPGHHAEPDKSMGFCLFNNAAVAAHHARKHHGAEKVAVVDFDVHHGNGTQAAFYNDPALLYVSTHQDPHYPGTGRADETGVDGNILNLPRPAGFDGKGLMAVMEGTIFPKLVSFKPDVLIISAGFDGHTADPLGDFRFEEEDYIAATKGLLGIADEVCGSRVVSVLEGGYDLNALAESAAAHIQTLMAA